MQQLLTIEQVANVLALSSATVMNWSYGRKPAPKLFPQPIKVGNRLRYLESEVERWIAAKSGHSSGTSEDVVTPTTPLTRPRGRPRKNASRPLATTTGAE